MNWRTIKDEARGVVHDTFKQKGVYEDLSGVKKTVHVRESSNQKSIGNYDGIGYPDMSVMPIHIIFLLSEVPAPVVNGLVTLDTGEKYSLDNVLEPDGLTITCEARVL